MTYRNSKNIFSILQDSENSSTEEEITIPTITSSGTEIEQLKIQTKQFYPAISDSALIDKLGDRKFGKPNSFSNNSNNHKKILCNNMLKFGVCNYNNKCLYAHHTDEQNIDNIRKRAYDIIKSTDNNLNIDLSQDHELAKTLIQLTKICNDCLNKICPGGYNCKYGTFDKKYQLCYHNIMYGHCQNGEKCQYIHLTDKGVHHINRNNTNIHDTKKPYRRLKMYENNVSYSSSIPDKVDNISKQEIIPQETPNKTTEDKNTKVSLPANNSVKDTSIQNSSLNIPHAILLTRDFFGNTNNISDDDLSDSEDSLDKIKQYLDDINSDIDPCDQSIFNTIVL